MDFNNGNINFMTIKKNVQKEEESSTKIVIKTKVNNNLEEVEELNLKYIVLCLLEDMKQKNFS